MYRDIITYELAEGVTHQHLLEVAQKTHDTWMQKLPGFVSWEIHTNKQATYTDIVTWKSREDAQHAETQMQGNEALLAWFGCYKPETIQAQNLVEVKKF